MTTFRRAHERDLSSIYDVFYQNEIAGIDEADAPIPPVNSLSMLRHILSTGVLYVAEEQGKIMAYSGAITRGAMTFLTDLFVLPGNQSSNLGKTLLEYAMPAGDGQIHCTMSSTDPRALALYIRSGMQPQWPHFNLRLIGPLRETPELRNIDVDVRVANVGDPALLAWDARMSGRARPGDHTYWVREQEGIPLWFERQGRIIGYGYVRPGAGSTGSLWYPQLCAIGPLGVEQPEDTAACVLAAVKWASQRAEVLYIDVPGPHRAIAPLLNCGFHIIYNETYLSSTDTPFFDARRYIASGSDLL
jgi:GNAT superfamily N-acetyltransferase